jgi:outer membrane protein
MYLRTSRNKFVLMRKLLLSTGLIALLLPGMAQEKWNLRQCVEYALANNVSVKQGDVQARITKLTYEQNRLQRYPNASLSGNVGLSSGRNVDPSTNAVIRDPILFSGVNFNTSVLVFNFHSLKHTIEVGKLDWQAQLAWVDKLKNDVALNVAGAYLQVLLSQEQANVAAVTLQQSQQNRTNVRRRVDVGNLPELNFLESDAQVARDSATLVTARATVQQNLLLLKAVMNLDAATPFTVELPPVDQIPVEPISELQPETVYNLAIQNLPQQKVNDIRILQWQRLIKASKAQMLPTVTAFGGMSTQYAKVKLFQVDQLIPTGTIVPTGTFVNVNGTNYNVQQEIKTPVFSSYRIPFGTQFSDNFGQNVGLSLSIPLFNNGQLRTQWKRAQLNLENQQLQKLTDNQTLKQDIYRAYTDAVAALERFNASTKTIQTAERAFDFSQKRYDIGLQSTIEYLTNQNNLFRARIERLQAQVEYVFRLKVLEFYKGQGIKLQ